MTQYGACYDGSAGVCATQKLDCAAGETWLEPKDALALYGFECACDDVLVGACESSTGTKTCAVDADSRGPGAPWATDLQPPWGCGSMEAVFTGRW